MEVMPHMWTLGPAANMHSTEHHIWRHQVGKGKHAQQQDAFGWAIAGPKDSDTHNGDLMNQPMVPAMNALSSNANCTAQQYPLTHEAK
jgi:hypothetical protein